MNQKTTIINDHEIFGDFLKMSESLNSQESSQIYWEWPGAIGNGFLYAITLRPGFMLGIGDYQLRENLMVSFELKLSSLVLGFGISGDIRTTVNYGQGQKDLWIVKSGQSYVSYLPEWQGVAKYQSRAPVRTVAIYIDPMLLNTYMEDQHDQIPASMRDILEETSKKHYYHSNNTTPAMNVAINQILNCPYRGPLKRMYFESKALELITHKLAQVASPECGLRNPSPLRPADIERIHEARDILISNMQNPPSLFNLARQVGLNETKLKRGFRQVYGNSVFRYLRNHRFEHARHLLEERRMNVSEVAFAIGYSRIDCFISSFKARFGITPGLYSRSSTLIS